MAKGRLMSQALESLLARLYSDAAFREAFLQDGSALLAQQPHLSEQDRAALLSIDRVGLKLAARSYAKKRSGVAKN
jgi:hypothetical protein